MTGFTLALGLGVLFWIGADLVVACCEINERFIFACSSRAATNQGWWKS